MPDVERLEQLKRVVREAPDHLFDMHLVAMRKPCGTAHCAWGWAMVDPWFLLNTDIGEVMPWESDDRYLELFGIDREDFDATFGGNLYSCDPAVSKEQVIDNIDRLIRGEPAIPYPVEPREDW
jgi:hypothetical protein